MDWETRTEWGVIFNDEAEVTDYGSEDAARRQASLLLRRYPEQVTSAQVVRREVRVTAWTSAD